MSKSLSWQRLDNAAKIFPPNSNKEDTKVFRFSCQLHEEVVPEILQIALDKAMIDFPLYGSIIRKGLFWYYFEASQIKPLVGIERRSPCGVMYDENLKKLLFEVTYYKKRINLEIYHALTDGVGALQFLRTLVRNYLVIKYQDRFKDQILSIGYDASMAQKQDDSFKKNFDKGRIQTQFSRGKAYKIKGEKHEGNRLQVIHGVVSVKAALEEAHHYGTTLTVYLSALLIYAIGKEMAVREQKKPIVLSVPVNLRPYFQSASARNFFSVVEIPYYFKEAASLEDIIQHLDEVFKKELTTERFKDKINKLVSLEHNYFTRVVPLFVKNPALKLAHHMNNKEVTTSLSNIGKVSMPKELEEYIDLFDVCVSTNKVQICMCSYQDKLSISFTSPFVSTEVQKNFFRELTARGVHVTVSTNIHN